jgi:hypothetical protein
MAPQSDEGQQVPYVDNLEYLLDELSRLDLLIHLRLLNMQSRQGANPLEHFKGLVLLEEEILQLVARAANTIGDESLETTNQVEAAMLAEDVARVQNRVAHRRATGLLDGSEILLARPSWR